MPITHAASMREMENPMHAGRQLPAFSGGQDAISGQGDGAWKKRGDGGQLTRETVHVVLPPRHSKWPIFKYDTTRS